MQKTSYHLKSTKAAKEAQEKKIKKRKRTGQSENPKEYLQL